MNSKTTEMGTARWSQIEELFARATDLEADERDSYLRAACAGDDELHGYLSDLLNCDATIAAGIEKTIVTTVNLAFGANDLDAEQMRGEMIGPYKVERMLGSGGMGIVYLAARADDQFDQQVAIKLGRHRLIDPQTVLRLRNERQILADLDHPNIARLYDGGTTDDGVPYIVMEHIDGVRIDTYCDVQRLSIVARLELFQAICGAVHHAHQSLVIHRDIKASNILVTRDGIPKLLDFGIAKLIQPAGEAADGLTREGAVIMTPANASPEQILGQSITTAIDIYALGLLLYDLLGGFRAFAIDELTPSEYAQLICYQQVTRPSLRLVLEQKSAARAGDAAAIRDLNDIADDRSTTIRRLQRRLRGDLDTIVLKTLRKEPERRYRSVSALADDIRLHLQSMPILARAESWRYRAGKFLRRHYAAVSAAAMIVAVLATFSVVLTVQNRTIAKERDTALEVSQFLEEIFEAHDPAEARGKSVTAREILQTGAERIQTRLADRPEIHAALLGTIGRVYRNLGEYQLSTDMLEQALQIRLENQQGNDTSVATAKDDLAATLILRAEYQRARSLLESALATNKKMSGATTKEVALNQGNLANLHLKTGDLGAAESYARAAIETYQQLQERGDNCALDAYQRHDNPCAIKLAMGKALLARIFQVRGDLDRTEVLLLEAIEIINESGGPDLPATAFYLQNLGVLQRSKGDFLAAQETLEKAVLAARRILGEKHDLVAATLLDQGTVLHMTGDLDGAEQLMREALALYVETRGAGNPVAGYTLTILGMLLHDKADLAEAESVLRRAVVIYDEALDDNNQYTASALTELGAVLNSTGHLAEAENLLQRALAIRLSGYPAEHEMVAATRTEYADTLTRLGFYEQAEPLLLDSVDTLRNKPGRRQQRAAAALARLYDTMQ
jgi:serine/threonine-protein kinase